MNQNSLEQSRSTATVIPAQQPRDTSKSLKGGRNRWHNLITTNLVVALGSRIQRSTTEIYVAGMKVQVGKDSICFPDVIVVSGEPVFSDGSSELLANPTVVVEIFSDEAPVGDRTQRLQGFLAIPSIKECLLVNETGMRIEHYARQNIKHWTYKIYDERDDVISLDAIGCKINLSEIYSGVKVNGAKLSSSAVN